MLVLNRKEGQRILIGGEVEIVLVSAIHGQAKIGITAPRDISIVRSELADNRKSENKPEDATDD